MLKLKLATLTFLRDIGIVKLKFALNESYLVHFLRNLLLWQFYSYAKIKISNVNIFKRHWNSCLS